jgi:hypothetical protein
MVDYPHVGRHPRGSEDMTSSWDYALVSMIIWSNHFAMMNLSLRVQALCRRGQLRQQRWRELRWSTVGDVQVVVADKQIQINGTALDLTPIEDPAAGRFPVRQCRAGTFSRGCVDGVRRANPPGQGVWGARHGARRISTCGCISHIFVPHSKMSQGYCTHTYSNT